MPRKPNPKDDDVGGFAIVLAIVGVSVLAVLALAIWHSATGGLP